MILGDAELTESDESEKTLMVFPFERRFLNRKWGSYLAKSESSRPTLPTYEVSSRGSKKQLRYGHLKLGVQKLGCENQKLTLYNE